MTQEWLKQVAGSALCYIETLEATYDIATSLLARSVPGDFVECGVFAGAHCAVMAKAILDWNEQCWIDGYEEHVSRQARVHLFDSFTGIPQAGPKDIEFLEAGKKSGESTCSRAQVEAYMKAWGIPSELLVYHEGLFSETVPFGPRTQIELDADQYPGMIALLRLDGDLYESTKVCVEYLLPLVSRGGWVCVDDLNLSGCRQALFEKIIPAPCYFKIPCK
jgi:hypothetical protein